MWRENLRNNEEGQCDKLPLTGGGGGGGHGANGFIAVTLTALWSPAWGKAAVSAEMGGGVNVPCRERKHDGVQAATPAMCGEILRVSFWRMCQNLVQQGSGFEERVPVRGLLERTSPHAILEVSHKDA